MVSLDSSVSIVTRLLAERSGIRILTGARDNVQAVCGSHPASSGYRAPILGVKRSHLRLVSRLRMIGAVPPLHCMPSWHTNVTPYLHPLFHDNGTIESQHTGQLMQYFGGPVVGVAD